MPYHLVNREQALAITKAMHEVFACVQVWEHRQTGILLGRLAPLVIDPARVRRALTNEEAMRDCVAAGLVAPTELADAFLCSSTDLEAAFASVRAVRDDRPDLEYADVGYGLSRQTPAQGANVREPFFAAQLRSRLPLAGFTPADEVSLRHGWRARSIARYASYLHASGRRDVESWIADRTRDDPSLLETPVLRGTLELIRTR
ncbi:MAG: hypothetical protein EXS13_15085 [Planctomycetes bacterium]|nr:hypothetical protein [Planctomycetota bacterium]